MPALRNDYFLHPSGTWHLSPLDARFTAAEAFRDAVRQRAHLTIRMAERAIGQDGPESIKAVGMCTICFDVDACRC